MYRCVVCDTPPTMADCGCMQAAWNHIPPTSAVPSSQKKQENKPIYVGSGEDFDIKTFNQEHDYV